MQPILQNGKQYACRDGHHNDDYEDCIETTSGTTVVVNSLLCFISNFRRERNISEIISTYFHADSLESAKRILIQLTNDRGGGDSETAFQQKRSSHHHHQNGIVSQQARKRRKCIAGSAVLPTTTVNGVVDADGCDVNADDNLVSDVLSLYDRFAHWHRHPRFVTDDLTALPLMLPPTDDALGNNNKTDATMFNGNDSSIFSGTEDVLCEIRQIRYYLQNITSSSSAAPQQQLFNNNNNFSNANNNNNNNTKCLKCVMDLNDDDDLATDDTRETKRISNGKSKRRARLLNSPTLSCRSNDGENGATAKINLKYCEKTPKADTISSAGNSVSPMSSTIADDDIESQDIINSSTGKCCEIVTRPSSPSLQAFAVSSAPSLLTPMKSQTKNSLTNCGVSLLSCSSSTSSALSHCCVSSTASSAISSPPSLLSSATKWENNVNNNCASLSSPNSITTAGNRLDRAVRKLTNRLEARLDHSVLGDVNASTQLTQSKTASDSMKSSLLCFNDNVTKPIPPLTQLTFESATATTNTMMPPAPTPATTTTAPTISNAVDPVAYMLLWKNFTAAAALAAMASTKPNNNINIAALGHFASLPALATFFGNRLERTKQRCVNSSSVNRKKPDETVDNLTKGVDERNAKYVIDAYVAAAEPDDDADDEEEEEGEGEEEEEVNICVVDGNDAPNADERVSSAASSSRASPPFTSNAATAAAAAAVASFFSSVNDGRTNASPMGVVKPEMLKTENAAALIRSGSHYFIDVQHGSETLKEPATKTTLSTRYVRSEPATMSSSSSSDDISEDDTTGGNDMVVASTNDTNNDVGSGSKATTTTTTATTTGVRTKSNNSGGDLVLDEDKQFVCTHDNCEKRFSNKFLLKKHQFTHTGLRPHACPFCPKRFNRKDNLLRHKKTHYANGLLEKTENGGGRKRHNMLYGVTQDTVHLISTLKNAVAAAAAASGAAATEDTKSAAAARIGSRQPRRKANNAAGGADCGDAGAALVPEVKRVKSEE